jgi:hypothetical protein
MSSEKHRATLTTYSYHAFYIFIKDLFLRQQNQGSYIIGFSSICKMIKEMLEKISQGESKVSS